MPFYSAFAYHPKLCYCVWGFRIEDLTNFAPFKDLDFIAIFGDHPGECLVIRLLHRKNLPQGCILSRPCFCDLSRPRAKQLCPFRAICPAISALVKPGEPPPPHGYYGTDVNKTIKDALAKILAPYDRSYTSHGFRRGASNELKTKGPQRTVVAGLGEWRPLAFKGYFDTTLEVAIDMSKLLIETDVLTEEEDEVLSLGIRGSDSRRLYIGR